MMMVLLLVLVCGCHSDKVSYSFPSDIRDLSYGCLNSSEEKIESKGFDLSKKWSCKVVKQDGERKISNIWAWQAAEVGGIWVYGMCNGKMIWTGCHPQTKQEIHPPTLEHEFGHYWLLSNYSMSGHDPRFRDVFFNWRDPSTMMLPRGPLGDHMLKNRYKAMKPGEVIGVVRRDEKGETWIYDVVKPEE